MKKIFAIIFAGAWITFSEFLRNEILFKSFWIEKYNQLGLVFTTTALNGILWSAWAMLGSWVIFELLEKFNWKKTFVITWVCYFVLMWIVIYNLQVLPIGIFVVAIPLSLLEIFVAIWIIRRVNHG